MNLSENLKRAVWLMDDAIEEVVRRSGRTPAQVARLKPWNISMNSVRDHIYRTIRHRSGTKR